MMGCRRGFLVAFVGVDGAGKSSVVHSLLRDPRVGGRKKTRLYFGGNEYWIPGALWLNARFDSVPLLKYFFRGLLRLDRQLRVIPALYFRWRGHLVLCDRYYFDDLVAKRQAARTSGAAPPLERIKWWFRARLVCRPDLTFYLDLSPEAAYARKQDYAFELLLQVDRAYREEMTLHRNVVIIDAERPRNDVQQTVVEHLQRLQVALMQPDRRIHAALAHRAIRVSPANPRWRRLREWLVVHGRYCHPRVTLPPSAVRAGLNALDRTYGRGTLTLTGSGALHHGTPTHVRAMALGPLSEAGLEINFRHWAALRTGPYAPLVDYECVRERLQGWTIYATERLSRPTPDWADLGTVLDALRGQFRTDQFDATSLDQARDVLTMRTDLRREQVHTLPIQAEAGFYGLLHGDLHWENVRRNRKNRLVLIDLDRVQHGAQVLDRIHCAVVHTERQRRQHWLTFFSLDVAKWTDSGAATFLRAVSVNSLRAYFLWRQSRELLSMPGPHRTYVKRLETCFHRLVQER